MASLNPSYVVAPRVSLDRVPFLAFFCTYINTERGVNIYMLLKCSLDNSDSKYIGFVGLTPSIQVLFPKNNFLCDIFSLTQNEKEEWPRLTLPVILSKLSFVCIKNFRSELNRFV